MTQGGGTNRISIRVTGDDTRDLEALLRWLSLEDWFVQARQEHRLEPVFRERNGTERTPDAYPDGPPMGGVIVELIIAITGAAFTPIFEDLYHRVKVAAQAWEDNRNGDGRRRVRAYVRPEPESVGNGTGEDGGDRQGPDGEGRR